MRWKLLFYVLSVVLCVVLAFQIGQSYLHPRAIGFLLKIGNFTPAENCELQVPLVLHVSADRALSLGNEPMSADQVTRWLDMILKERVRPVLYIEANSEITVQQFAQVLDLISKTNKKTEIRIVTPGNRKQSCLDFRPGPAA